MSGRAKSLLAASNLPQMSRPEMLVYDFLYDNDGVTALMRKRKLKAQVSGVGSLFCLHWTGKRLGDYRSSRPADPAEPLRVFMGLLNEGIVLSQRGMGACSLAMTEADIDRFSEALGKVLDG